MNFVGKKYKNLSLMAQLIVVFSICIIASVGISIYVGISDSMELYISKMEDDSRNLARYAASQMEATGNIDWLMRYWKANYESMDIVYEDSSVIKEKHDRFMQLNPGLDIDTITTEELTLLPAESRKLYAEFEFMRLTNMFDDLKRTYHPTFLFCCSKGNADELFYYVTGVEEGDVRGTTADKVFVLGSTSYFDPNMYPVAEKTFETGVEQLELEQPVKTGKDSGYYQVYIPLLSRNGDVLGLVGVTLESYSARGKILESFLPSQVTSAILFLVCAIVLAIMVQYLLIKPVIKVQKNVKEYSADKDSAKVVEAMKQITSRNEVGNLAEVISDMVVEIDRYTNEVSKLATDKERIHAELNLATTIQAATLPCVFPPFPEKTEFEIFATMDPAKEVGGDFYDFFLLDDNHLALVIADVSGKGIPAAMFMMISKILIKNNARFSMSPAQILEAVNNQLCENNEAEMFVTVWLGILEISSGKMIASSAGHEYPCIRRAGEKYALYKDKHGFVVGGMEGVKYKDYELCFNPGDEMYVYTDGVAEATNVSDELFGTQRLIDTLNSELDVSIDRITSNVRNAIDEFVGEAPQFDDITMMSFRYLGTKE